MVTLCSLLPLQTSTCLRTALNSCYLYCMLTCDLMSSLFKANFQDRTEEGITPISIIYGDILEHLRMLRW